MDEPLEVVTLGEALIATQDLWSLRDAPNTGWRSFTRISQPREFPTVTTHALIPDASLTTWRNEMRIAPGPSGRQIMPNSTVGERPYTDL